MDKRHPRLVREDRTMAVMIGMYCHARHGEKQLCRDCRELLSYAGQRLAKCPFQEGKTTCARCKVHCYRKEMRENVRLVMRYAGPRMIWRHPALAVLHLLDGIRKEPRQPSKKPKR